MNQRTTARLEAAAQALLKGRRDIPVDLDQISRDLGLDVIRRPTLDYQGEAVSGLLIQKSGRRVCAINTSDPPNRQRFTWAHEIGHLILHPTRTEHFDMKARSSSNIGNAREEAEANQFAASLLMPAYLVREKAGDRNLDLYWDDWRDSLVSDLAREFKVSVEAMSIRLHHLGLIS